ncbi:MAG: aminoacyl-tRNA hydrolase [Lachnospiraceae bacterium]|nr:aminoacyl-tRNA hydrolase [Lachnospiraceae bacterium]
MYIIAGLGNPGSQYDKTRHNIGFQVLTCLADKTGISLNGQEKKAIIGKGRIGREKVILCMPITYMNNSGEAIGALSHYYKIKPEDELIIVYDDVDLDPGKLRIRKKGSAGGHNGMKSIIKHLGTDTFARVRVGVGSKPPGMDLAAFVLGKFPKELFPTMNAAVESAADAIITIVEEDADTAMNKYN